MADKPQHRAPPPRPPPVANDGEPGQQGPTTKTFSIKMASWLTDLEPGAGAEGPLVLDEAPAAPSPAAAPPPDTASPFASRPYHLFADPPAAAAAPEAPAPGIRAPTPLPVEHHPAASAVPPIPALAASAVPPIPGLAGGVREDEPRSIGLLVVVGLAVALAAAGGASWFLWGEQIRALLKI